MSVTITIAGQEAVLADGAWRSALPEIAKVLNNHLEGVQLEVPGHLPPHDRELELARLACEAFAGSIIDSRADATDPTRMTDGRQIVYGKR